MSSHKSLKINENIGLTQQETTKTEAKEMEIHPPAVNQQEGTQIDAVPSAKKRKVQDRELWKLVKGKYMLGFYLCAVDWNKLYNNKERVRRNENGEFTLSFDLCEECALANVRATDILAPPKTKKRTEKTEQQ